jgi:hypothetical protein
MPTIYGIPAFLRLQESSQSGSKTMTGAYVIMYEDSNTNPWMFSKGSIDLSNMASLDVVHVKVSVKLESTGSYAVHELQTYTGVQPVGQKVVQLPVIPNLYGVKIEAYQSAGTYRVIPMRFFVAKR